MPLDRYKLNKAKKAIKEHQFGKDKRPYTLDTVFVFGKYKGKSVSQVLDINPRYVQWCLETIEWFKLDKFAIARLDEYMNSEDDDGGDYYGPGHPSDYGDN